MDRILERLDKSLTWSLVAPGEARVPPTMTGTRRSGYLRTLGQVRTSRVTVFRLDDANEYEATRSTDRAAWHVVATDRAGVPAGALRLFIVDRQHEALEPMDVLAFGHVTFPCPAVQSAHLGALEQLFARNASKRTYIYAGGFFTTEKWRGSGLAAALGMAAIAMARLHDSRFVASFVSARDRAPELFALLGARPLPDRVGQSLAPFVCVRHGFPLQLMEFDSLHLDPRVERGLEAMVERMHRMTVLAPEADT
jgi:GNAT superfamily N-acetyltransferase